MATPKVTIGICVKNAASTLCEAIESIKRQDFPHELMEVVLVDDGSKDSTLAIANSYVSKMDMSVKIFRHEWKGLGPSRNEVINHARGDYIIWVDGDMILPKDHVRKQVDFMEQYPKVGIGKARYGFMRGESVVTALENSPFVVFDLRDNSLNTNLPGTGGAIYRVKPIKQIGGFDSDMKGVGEDQDIAYRVKAAGWTIARSPAYFYERRVKTWRDLWRKNCWYGYGDYQLYRKNRSIFSLFRMVPMTGFVVGALYSVDVYRLAHRKSSILLPFHFVFRSMAWCCGFAKAQVSTARAYFRS